MAFAEKYKGQITDTSGAVWTVDVKVDGGTHSANLTLDGVPIVIRMVDDQPGRPWGRQRVSIDIRTRGELTVFDEIRDSGLQTYQVAVSNNDGTAPVAMTVWADTRNMRTQIGALSLNVLRCTDGLDHLKGIPWYANQAAADTAGRVTVVAALSGILANVGLTKAMRTQFAWYPNLTDYTVNDVDPLAVTELEAGWLYHKLMGEKGGSQDNIKDVWAWDALEHLLRRFQLKLTLTSDDYWLLRHRGSHTYDARTDSHYGWTYNAAGTQTGEANLTRYLRDLNESHTPVLGDNYERYSGTSIDTASLSYEHQGVTDLLPKIYFFNQFSDAQLSSRWLLTGTGTVSPWGDNGMGVYIDARAGNTTTTITLAQARTVAAAGPKLSPDASTNSWYGGDGNYLEFRGDVAIVPDLTNWGANYPGRPAYAFYTISASADSFSTVYYLKADGSWSTTVTANDSLLYVELESGDIDATQFARVSVRANMAGLTTQTYKIKLTLYGAADLYYNENSDNFILAGVIWKDLSLTYFQADSDIFNLTRTTVRTTGLTAYERLDDIPVYIGDGPVNYARSALLSVTSDQFTANWSFMAKAASGNTLDDLWLKELFEYWQKPAAGLVATFKNVSGASANDVRHDHIIRFPITTGKPYFPVSVEWDVKHAQTRFDALACAGTTADVTPTDVGGGGSVPRVEDVRSIVAGPDIWLVGIAASTTAATFTWRTNDHAQSITWKVTTTATFDIASGTTITVNPKTRLNDDEQTTLTADTAYWVHFQAYSQPAAAGNKSPEYSITFRTAAAAAATTCTPVTHPNALALYLYQGTGAPSDADTVADYLNNFNATYQVLGATVDGTYTDRGLALDETADTKDYIEASGDLYNLGVLTCLLIIDVVDGDASSGNAAAQYLAFHWGDNLSGADSEMWFNVRGASGRPDVNYKYQGGATQNYNWNLAADGVNGIKEACALGFAMDVPNNLLTQFTVKRSNGELLYYEVTNFLSSVTTKTTNPTGDDDSTNEVWIAPTVLHWANSNAWEVTYLWTEFVGKFCSVDEIKTMYTNARNYLLCDRPDATLAAELPVLSDVIIPAGAYGATIAVGTESTNTIVVSIQLLNASGLDLTESATVTVFLSDASPPTAITTTAPSGGWTSGTDGFIVYEPTAGKVAVVTSEADGDIDLSITEAGVATWYLNVQLANGTLITSAAITFA